MRGLYILLLSLLLLGIGTMDSISDNDDDEDEDNDDEHREESKKSEEDSRERNPNKKNKCDKRKDHPQCMDSPERSKSSTTAKTQKITKYSTVQTTKETLKSTKYTVTSATEQTTAEITTRSESASIFVPLSISLFLVVLLAALLLWIFRYQCRRKLNGKDEMKPGTNVVTIYATAGHPQGNEGPAQLPQPGHIYQEISDAHVRAPDSSYSAVGLPYQDQKAADQQPGEGQYSLLGLPTSDRQQKL